MPDPGMLFSAARGQDSESSQATWTFSIRKLQQALDGISLMVHGSFESYSRKIPFQSTVLNKVNHLVIPLFSVWSHKYTSSM